MMLVRFAQLIYNIFLGNDLGVPQMTSIHRLFRAMHACRFVRIHSLLRHVVEAIFVALSNIHNTLLLEFVIVTVFALLSIAFEGDTPFWDSSDYEPYENYTEALYSYYMCTTFEGVNEVAEHILYLDSPHLTTVIGLAFYIFAALVTYSTGQLLAGLSIEFLEGQFIEKFRSAVIASTLGKTIDRIVRETSQSNENQSNIRLVGIQRSQINHRFPTKHRCKTSDTMKIFSKLQPNDLLYLIFIFRTFEKNFNESEQIVLDLRRTAMSIGKLNQKTMIFSSPNDDELQYQQHRLNQMIKTLSKI